MPIYLDRHDPPDEVTAEHVAEMHQKDLKVQHEYGCRGFTYWFDEKRKSGFCLIEAPNKEALEKMHHDAHGGIPSQIIEVEEHFVESFLGRLEDPENKSYGSLNIIDDSAFRVILLTQFKRVNFQEKTDQKTKDTLLIFNSNLESLVNKWNGNLVKHETKLLLSSFKIAKEAIECAFDIQSFFNNSILPYTQDFELQIGLSCGEPVTEKEKMFEDTITLAKRLGNVVQGQIVASSELKTLFETENIQSDSYFNNIVSIPPSDELFLNQFIDFIESTWSKPDLKIEDIESGLGLSKSKLYRKIKCISGFSPNTFIKEYRLRKAMELINLKKGNVSEIAFESGFNSPAYFSKCFYSKYGLLPSAYINR